MASNEDIDEFVTCGVCFLEYDEEIRKPKFLPCSHTVCLLCLQGIVRGTTIKSIMCPFCRHLASTDTTKQKKWVLPNNTYALQMLKWSKQTTVSISSAFACPQMKNINMDTLLKSKEELLKIRDAGINKLALAIQKRREVQEQMALIIEAINVAGEEAKKFQDENNLSLAKMVSVLEEKKLTVSSTKQAAVSQNGQRRHEIISELMSLVEDSTTNDSIETLKQKMKKSVEFYEHKLDEATAIASEYELRQRTKIRVLLYDENDRRIPTLSVLETGFRFQPITSYLYGPLCIQDSKLLSHAIFWLLQRQNISIKSEHQSVTCNSKSSSVPSLVGTVIAKSVNASSSMQVTSLPPRVPSNSTKFVLGQSSIFILKLYKSGTSQGEIHIRPSLAFHPTFVQQLGEFCFESPKNFGSYIDKAIPGVFVSFALSSDCHPGFYPMVPSMFDSRSTKTAVADVNTAIGIAMVESYLGNNMVTGWNFIIPLKDWHYSKCEVAHSVLNNEMFGRIIRCTTNGSVTIMSKSIKSERGTYTLTIESALKSAIKSSSP